MAKRKGRKMAKRRHPAKRRTRACRIPRSVVSERVLISPKGRRYRILKTTEKTPTIRPTIKATTERGNKDK